MAVNFIVDAIIVLILLIGVILGIKRGFVEIVAKPFRIVASLGVAIGLSKPFGEQYIQPHIQNHLVNRMTDLIEKKCGEIVAGSASSDIPTILKIVAWAFGVDVDTVAQGATDSIVKAVVDALAQPLANFGARVAAFLVLLIVTSIVCWLLFKIIGLVLRSGPLEVVNKGLGLIFGALFSFLLVWSLAYGLAYVLTIDVVSSTEVFKDFTGGPIYLLVNKINPIDLLFKY